MENVKVRQILQSIAASKGWILQPNQDVLIPKIRGMAKRAIVQDDGTTVIICPCKAYVPDMVELDQVRCPCPEAPGDIEENDSCNCKVFLKR